MGEQDQTTLHLAELARAHHDRQQGAAAEPPRPVMPQTEAQLHVRQLLQCSTGLWTQLLGKLRFRL